MARQAQRVAELLRGRRTLVLTGAGCSTESGIPDYRGPETRRRARNPIQFKEFLHEAPRRQHYWARSVLGWPRFWAATPNAGHRALARLEAQGHLHGLITQNVDKLHHKAGSQRVVELHGALDRVRCLACQAITPRALLQERLLALNPGWHQRSAQEAPDGDASLSRQDSEGFVVADCAICGGLLKPDVVFFGENVPRPVYDQANTWLEQAQALLVIGSSLAVYSGFRFVREAHRRGLPVVLINLGPPQRGQDMIEVHWDAAAGEALAELSQTMETQEERAWRS